MLQISLTNSIYRFDGSSAMQALSNSDLVIWWDGWIQSWGSGQYGYISVHLTYPWWPLSDSM